MSYVSNDSGLWWNLSGICAAYQPVRAPDPLLARYNQANGGVNTYKVNNAIAPQFSSRTGWSFTKASSQSLIINTGFVLNTQWTALVRLTPANSGTKRGILGNGNNTENICLGTDNKPYSYSPFSHGISVANTAITTDSVIGVSRSIIFYIYHWLNGILDNTPAAVYGAVSQATDDIGLGDSAYFGGYIYAIAIYNRTLSPAEVWTASRQMAYCDVNPDWSVWGRRRQWYYAPSVGGLLRHPGMSGHIESGRMHPGMSGGIDG